MKKFWQRLVLFGLTGAFFVSCISCSAANTASKVPILMYHNLTNDPSAVTSMTITGERFQEDMEYLEYNGYTPLLSADLIDIRAGKEAMPERPVMITFDDGYRSNYDIAYPILQKTGMKAVIALIGKSIRAEVSTPLYLKELSPRGSHGHIHGVSEGIILQDLYCRGQISSVSRRS